MPQFSEEGMKLLKERYLHQGEDPEDMLDRVAFSTATNQKEYKTFKKLLDNLWLLPSTPIYVNSGTNMPCLLACYVSGCEDSINSIMDTAKLAANIFRYSGGLGLDLSKLRENGATVRSTRSKASGPVSFLQIFSAVAEVVKQGSRRAALLGSLEVEHPDILEFINCKNLDHNGGDESYLKNFNLSVIMSNDYMTKIQSKEGNDKEKKIFDAICYSIWTSGEPGLIFRDRAEALNPVSYKYKLLTSNSCSELILADKEACNLASVNLFRMLNEKENDVDWDRLEYTVRNTVKFLDNILSISVYPAPEIESKVKELRRIGIGMSGLHSLMFTLGMQYNSAEGLFFMEKVMKFINDKGHDESEQLAKKLGAFPAYDENKTNYKPRRNVTITSLPPTGTVTTIGRGDGMPLSYGPEPYFSRNFFKDVLGGETFCLPDSVVCAIDMTPEEHILAMEALMKNVDTSIAKTVNMSNETSVEDIKKAALRAYNGRLIKAVAFYRDGSRNKQIFNNIKEGQCKGGSCSL
jgi:ribonucleoside-diphosphate reductase alpha chain